MPAELPVPEARSLHFIEEIVEADRVLGKHGGRVLTRFPPEPNGYLHIGHAKSICLNFGLANTYGGATNLRFDDTNPVKEDVEYVDSIREDVHWLGFQWKGEHYASDYFPFMYDYAEHLIQQGKAYVCDLTEAEIREYRGNFHTPGKPSPYRERSPEENLELFRRMKAGEFPDGSRVLRAKIDMQSGNMNLRDPLMYRIRRAHHHRTGDAWCIYPMYDFAHGVSDALETITHSICTLEFEDHRPLYDWFLEQDVEGRFFQRPLPRQIEFARLNLTYTVMSKRRLLQLVQEGIVRGWDDPRMPTICGLRRRGYTPEAVRAFTERVGGWPSATWWPTRAFWNTASARTWNGVPRGAWPCCAPSRWSSPIWRMARASTWKCPTTPRTRPWAPAGCSSPGSSSSTRMISGRRRPRSGSAWPRAPRCACGAPA